VPQPTPLPAENSCAGCLLEEEHPDQRRNHGSVLRAFGVVDEEWARMHGNEEHELPRALLHSAFGKSGAQQRPTSLA